jgi:group I intron endonuclease
MTHCIYIHQNKNNLKIYVGYSSNVKERWRQTKLRAKQLNFVGYDEPFYKAIRRDGWNNFTHQIIEEFDNPSDALEAEQFWIEFFRSNRLKYGKNYGYNLTNGGEAPMLGKSAWNKGLLPEQHPAFGKPGTMLGKTHSEETKQKISKALIGNPRLSCSKGKTWKLVGGKRTWMDK